MAESLPFNVNVDAPEVTPFGLNEAVTPSGNPLADKVTLPVKPAEAEILIVLVTVAPCRKLTVAGLAASVNTAGQLLTRLKALTVPIPVAKSQPVVAAKAG